MNTWKKVEIGNAWNFKELGVNATIEGLYIGKEEHVGENDSTIYSIEVKGGDVMNVWGSAVLDVRLKNIKVGEEVRIVYLGSMKSEKRKGSTYHNFDVYHREVPYAKVDVDDIPDNLG